MATVNETWQSMSLSSRISVGVFAGVILLMAIAAAVWALSDRYETLFTSMEPRDAAAVVSELERMGIPYQLADGGTRIAVPGDRVHEIRVKLMGSGVPLRGGVGFEIFDNSDFGMTEFAQKINYQRALEGELTRTITSLKEVKYARVHLVMPESSLFQQQQSPPSASVTLFLKDGARLDESRILGLQRLVAAAVPGLEAKGVTVADQDGMTLSRNAEPDAEMGSVSARLEKKQEVEDYLTNKVVEVLDRALGSGHAVVSVDVSLNMNQVRTTREEVIPHSDAQTEVLRRRESRSDAGGSGAAKRGNVVTEVEYQLGRQVEQIVLTPGAIDRLSVGVLVPRGVAAERVEEIRSLVAMAVGLNAARGDAIAVFATSLPIEQAEDGTASSLASEGVTDMPAGPNVPAETEILTGERTAAESAQLVDSKELTVTLPSWLQGTAGLVAIGGTLLVALLALMVFSLWPRGRRLRPEERARILEQLENWVQAESVAPSRVAQQRQS